MSTSNRWWLVPDRKLPNDQWATYVREKLGVTLQPWQEKIVTNLRNDDPMCLMCHEPVWGDAAQDPVYTEDGPRIVHWQCMLREVTGGIGHLIAHYYWCGAPRHDPDAGLTYRQ